MSGLQQGTKEFAEWWLSTAAEHLNNAAAKWRQYPCAAMYQDREAAQRNYNAACAEARRFGVPITV